MFKLKIFETVLFAVSVLITAAKAVIKFIGYISKLNKKSGKAAA